MRFTRVITSKRIILMPIFFNQKRQGKKWRRIVTHTRACLQPSPYKVYFIYLSRANFSIARYTPFFLRKKRGGSRYDLRNNDFPPKTTNFIRRNILSSCGHTRRPHFEIVFNCALIMTHSETFQLCLYYILSSYSIMSRRWDVDS